MLITWFLAPLCLRPFIQPDNFAQEMSFLNIRILGLPFLYLFQCGNAFLISTLNSRFMMIGTIGEALINIFFDYVLIYGALSFPKLGFNGAAVASVIAEFSGVLIVYFVIYQKGLKKKFYLFSDLAYDKTNTRAILKLSAPLVLQFSISLITWLLFFILLESYGDTAKAISNTMRNVFGIVGVFIWAFASTSNTMVSNLIGQKKENKVISVINRIMLLSFSLTLFMVIILNIFPHTFFSLYSQGKDFTSEGVSVLRVVSIGMLGMSIAAIWLNAVTGTGKTRMNLLIELIAVSVYILYIYFVMVRWKLSLPIAWGNELIYWTSIFSLAFIYIKSGRWKTQKAS
jgi:multidrug resistance protein, MATE family